MKKSVYCCDICNKVLSDGSGIEIEHIHIRGSARIAYKTKCAEWSEEDICSSKESQCCVECFWKAINEAMSRVKE